MIDSSKLLTNRSSGATVLSRKSVTNIGIIREDVIKVDKLLKDRLVLSKVREGIERQNQERLRRVGREETLEKDDDRDDDIDLKKKDPKPKRGGGLIAFLIGGVVSTIGFFALKFLPQLATLGKFFKVIFKSFTFVAGGALTALGGFISMFNQSSTQLKGIDKDLTKEKKINNVFEDFTNSLRSVVYALILGGASALGIRAFRKKGMMSEAAITDLLQEMGQDARRGKTGMKGGFMEMMTEDELLDYLRGKQIREFERDFGYLDDDMVKPTKTETKPNVVKKKRTPRVIRKKVQPQKVLSEVLVGDRLGVSAREPEFFTRLGLDPSFGRRGVDPRSILKEQRVLGENLLARDIGLDDELNRLALDQVQIDKAIAEADEFMGVDEKTGKLLKERNARKRRKDAKPFKQIKAEIDARNPTYRGTSGGKLPLKPGMPTLGKQPMFTAPKIKASKFTGVGKKGLGKFLSELGIGGSLKPIRKFISESIGAVPLIGDLIAFLLDVFVFGEPPGRAAFMAIGSLALGGLLAGVGSALGPVGTILGGIVGGVGGDILGGIAYDLFFKKGRDSSRPSFVPATKGVTRTFEDGGYVNPDLPRSNFKPLVNSVDKSTEISSTPFYNKTTAGRVSFVPFPLVIPSKEQSQQEEQLIAMDNKASETRTFSNLYKR